MNNMKFDFVSEDNNEEILHELLRLGFKFDFNPILIRMSEFIIAHVDKSFFVESMTVSVGIGRKYFDGHPYTETTLEELKAM